MKAQINRRQQEEGKAVILNQLEEINHDDFRKETDRIDVKLVLVGNTAVGKSCLITSYLKNTFSEEVNDYKPTVLEVNEEVKIVNQQQVSIKIHDLGGKYHPSVDRKAQYEKARARYDEAQAIYDVTNKARKEYAKARYEDTKAR